jgi:hypothetical protein
VISAPPWVSGFYKRAVEAAGVAVSIPPKVDPRLRKLLRSFTVSAPGIGISVELLDEVRESRLSLHEKIEAAHLALTRAAAVLEELQTNLSEQAHEVEKARSEYEHYAELAQIEEEQAKSLLHEIGRSGRRERWIQILAGIATAIVFFVIGFFVG